MKLLLHEVDSFGLSDIGLVRPNNEDVFRILSQQQFYVLADGMGGHNAGEVASLKAVESVCSSVQHLEGSETPISLCNELRSAIEKANATVYTLSHQNKDFSGMGTTLSCFLLHEKLLIYAHVGDSRLYRKRQKLQKLTEDHSLRHVLLTNEEQPNTALPDLLYRNVITRAIGTHQHVLPDVGIISLQQGDIYMLCSDGLTDYVPEEAISEILTPDSTLNEMAHGLINCALEKGGNDNITVLLVKILK